jgi:hypothetical protein
MKIAFQSCFFLTQNIQKKSFWHLNGMSSIGYLGRFFETARTPSKAPPNKNSSKKILKNKNH